MGLLLLGSLNGFQFAMLMASTGMFSLAHGLRVTGLKYLAVFGAFVSQKARLQKRKSSLFPGVMVWAFRTFWPKRCECEDTGSGEAW